MKYNFILYKIDGRLNLNASIFKMSELNLDVEKEEDEMSPHLVMLYGLRREGFVQQLLG
jgi:hypothetical protein